MGTVKENKLMKCTVITKMSVYDPNRDCNDEGYDLNLVREQFNLLQAMGYDISSVLYLIKLDGDHYMINTIYDAIQYLSLKEGADLVKFENGNIGYAGYYGNTRPTKDNCFEIVCPASEIISRYIHLANFGDGLDLCGNYDADIMTEDLVYRLNSN